MFKPKHFKFSELLQKLAEPNFTSQFYDEETEFAFISDLCGIMMRHFGGRVIVTTTDAPEDPVLQAHHNSMVPEGGGFWGSLDPDTDWFVPEEDKQPTEKVTVLKLEAAPVVRNSIRKGSLRWVQSKIKLHGCEVVLYEINDHQETMALLRCKDPGNLELLAIPVDDSGDLADWDDDSVRDYSASVTTDGVHCSEEAARWLRTLLDPDMVKRVYLRDDTEEES